MNFPNTIELQLSLPGLQDLNPLVDDFASRVFELAAIAAPRRDELHEALLSAVVLVEHALESGGDIATKIDIAATINCDGLEFRILEHGMPLGEDFERGAGREIRSQIRPAQVYDKVYWIQKGSEGSELHLVAHRDTQKIEILESSKHRVEANHDAIAHNDLATSASTEQYKIRSYAPDDGLAIARRIYEAYGRSYPNPDLYVPERIERLNREGRLHSIVCTSPTGEVVGHYALERPDLGPIGEAGQAVIDHRHRGHGLMGPMRSAIEEAGVALGLLGIWSQPTARHPVSQRMNLKFGSKPSALCLGTTPAEATLRGGVDGQKEDLNTPARHSCFLYWHPLEPEPRLVAFVPESLRQIITRLYAERGRDATLITHGEAPPEGHHTVHTRFDPARGVAWIAIDQSTKGAYDSIRAAVDALEGGAGAATIFIDLPIDHPGTMELATILLEDGVRFSGIAPRARLVSDTRRAEDVLRLQLNSAPVDIAGLVIEGEVGNLLAEAVLATQ